MPSPTAQFELVREFILAGKFKKFDRYPHTLRVGRRGKVGELRIYVDTETYVTYKDHKIERQKLKFGWALFERVPHKASRHHHKLEWFRFTSPGEFWNWVLSKLRSKTRITIFCHNVNFDAAVLRTASELFERGFRITEVAYSGRLKWLTFTWDKCSITITDTLNYFPVSIAELGKSLGLEKLEMPAEDAPPEAWDEYCRRDVEVIYRAVKAYEDFLAQHDYPPLQLTTPQQALAIFACNYARRPVRIHAIPAVDRLERSAYYGGRTEVNFKGVVPGMVYKLDINSAYPYVMSRVKIPYRLVFAVREANLDQLLEWIERYRVIARVWLDTDKPYYPARRYGYLFFPVGQFATTLATPELKLALQSGHIRKVGPTAVYLGDVIFKDYVDALYSKRVEYKQAGNTAWELMCKLLLNGLYGKFGQKIEYWEECDALPITEGIDEEFADCSGEGLLKHIIIDGKAYHLIKDAESFHAFPAIAAHVTSACRLLLLSYAELAGWDNVYYMDTDSLFVNQEGYDRLREAHINPTMLGKLKLEDQGQLHVFNKKHYIFNGELKVKGVRDTALALSESTFISSTWWGYIRSLKEGVDGEVIIEAVQKQLSDRLTTKIFLGNGQVKPPYFEEPEATLWEGFEDFPPFVSPD